MGKLDPELQSYIEQLFGDLRPIGETFNKADAQRQDSILSERYSQAIDSTIAHNPGIAQTMSYLQQSADTASSPVMQRFYERMIGRDGQPGVINAAELAAIPEVLSGIQQVMGPNSIAGLGESSGYSYEQVNSRRNRLRAERDSVNSARRQRQEARVKAEGEAHLARMREGLAAERRDHTVSIMESLIGRHLAGALSHLLPGS